MKYIIITLLTVLLLGCSRKTCIESAPVYRDSYKRYLIIMNESLHPKKLVMPREIEEAISFLEVVSGILSKAEINESRNYRDKSDFKTDIQLWTQWYKKNRCKVTLQYVDSAFKSKGLKIQ